MVTGGNVDLGVCSEVWVWIGFSVCGMGIASRRSERGARHRFCLCWVASIGRHFVLWNSQGTRMVLRDLQVCVWCRV